MTRQAIKFDVAFLGKIQRRRKTQTRRPVRYSKLVDGRRVMRPCPFRELETYQLVVVEDKRLEWDELTAEERRVYLRRGAREGSAVYKPVETALDGEFVRVTRKPRTQALIDIADDELAAEGFDEREEFIDYMGAVYGEHVETVWVVEFEWSHDGTLYLARQAGYAHPEQYTSERKTAIDDAPVVDSQTLASFAERNRERFQQERSAQIQAEELRNLGVRLKELQRRQRDLGIDCSLAITSLKREIEDLERQMDEAA